MSAWEALTIAALCAAVTAIAFLTVLVPLLARLAVEHKVSITVTLKPNGCELRTEPWAPLQYVCPCGKGENT